MGAITQNKTGLLRGASMTVDPRSEKYQGYDVSLAELEELDSNENRVAEVCAKLYAGQYLYDTSAGEWYVYTGLIWQTITVQTFHHVMANDLAALFSWGASQAIKAYGQEESFKDKDSVYHLLTHFAKSAGTRRFLEDVEHFLIGNPRMAIPGDSWDAQPHLLVCANAIIDLRTGKEEEPNPSQCLRKSTGVWWEGLDAPAPKWEAFQLQIANGDNILVGFKQMNYGYSLTGYVSERKMTINHGRGANGKSVESEVIFSVLGDYAYVLPSGVLLDSARGRVGPQPEVVELQGRRFVLAAETTENAALNTSLIKWVTGGDTLTARGNYAKKMTTWTPTHHIFLSTNNVPRIFDTSPATWDRIVIVDYPMRFVDNPQPGFTAELPRDPELANKLRQEASGILAWLVRGAVKWCKQGRLVLPQSVRYAVEDERGTDVLSVFDRFIADYCELGAYETPAADLLDAFNNAMEWEYSPKAFAKLATARFQKKRVSSGNVYSGLKLKSGIM